MLRRNQSAFSSVCPAPDGQSETRAPALRESGALLVPSSAPAPEREHFAGRNRTQFPLLPQTGRNSEAPAWEGEIGPGPPGTRLLASFLDGYGRRSLPGGKIWTRQSRRPASPAAPGWVFGGPFFKLLNGVLRKAQSCGKARPAHSPLGPQLLDSLCQCDHGHFPPGFVVFQSLLYLLFSSLERGMRRPSTYSCGRLSLVVVAAPIFCSY